VNSSFTKEKVMAAIELLKRQSIEKIAPQGELVRLAKECNSLLGYKVLSDRINLNQRNSSLRQALSNLEIQPFSPDSVAQYKATKLVEAQRGEIQKYGTALELANAFFDIRRFVARIQNWSNSTRFGRASKIACRCVAQNAIGWRWEILPLANYPNPIPEFVLRKAAQIQRAYPNGQLFVEHLTIDPDPFLIVRSEDGKEEFYVEVWNEPRFEAAF